MKKLLLIIAGLVIIIFCSGFKKNNDKKIVDLLCNKNWVTNSVDDKASKVFIFFNADNTYEQKYVIDGKGAALYKGKWSIESDKKIHIKFDESKIYDVYEILFLSKHKLEIKTFSTGFKKLILDN